MTAPVYEHLLALQDLDLTLLQLRHKHRKHPLRDQIAETETEISTHQVIADEIGERRTALESQQASLDAEVATIETRRSEIDAKLYDGSVTATKDLLALQDEAKMLKDRQIALEDDELEIMEQVEQVDEELAPVEEQIRSLVGAKAEHEVALADALTEIDQEVARLTEERGPVAQLIPDELLSHYDNLREDLGGVAVARLVGSTCDGCHMTMSAVAFDQIRRQPDDAVINCDQCGRILIR